MLMHDPQHSGCTGESLTPSAPTGRLNVKWKVGLGERVEIEAQPIVAYGYVYIGVMNGKFHAIDADTGQIAWTFQAGGAIAHTAAAANGKVYFGCEDGKVYALDANTGGRIWSYQTGGPLLSSPTVVDHTLYIGSFDTYLYALDAETGDLRWRYPTGGRVWTSPAVVNDRVYFGSEDMYAYCLDVASGGLVWKRLLSGVSMRNTYPVVSHGVAVFTTVKPGVDGYMPWEDLEPVQGLTPEQVVDLWNDYYQQFPDRRYLFYLDANTGEDKWDPINKKFVPFPLPYWGLIIPLVDSGGFAWFPASGGGGDHVLDHNFRLWKVSLADGTISQAGSQGEYMMQLDETGTHTMGGGKYYQTAQMNVGMFDPITKQKYHIYGGPWWPYGEPLDPTPTIHRNRYAGAGWAIWAVPASSPLVIANGVGYYTAYSWLYALTPNVVAEPGVVNLGIDHTLGPPHTGTYDDFVDELNWRVEQITASGPLRPQPLFWGWIRPTLHSFWLEGETVASLAGTMPYLRSDLQEDLKAYLKIEATTHLFQEGYTYRGRCLVYGENDIVDPCDTHDYPEDIIIYWFADDLNVIAENLYAMWAYAHYTGDWQTIVDNWDLITGLYGRLVGAFDSELGFYVERNPDGSAKRWHTPDFKPNLQIAAMLGVSRMAEHMGDTVTKNGADSLLQQMYQARVKVGKKVQSLYDEGVLQRVDSWEELENYEIMPYQGYRDRDTDVRQVYWTDDERWEIAAFPKHTGGSESGVITGGLVKYSDLIGYRPLFPELGAFLQGNLQDETAQYVQTVTNLNPWWYWNDASHCMQVSGEDLYNRPHLSAAIFQAKAYVLGEDFYTLKDQLPWEYTEAGFRDIYRLQNLVALLQAVPRAVKSVSSVTADSGDVLTYAISLAGTGATATVTDTIPPGTTYVPDSAHIEPQIGTLTADSSLIHWTGVLTEYTSLKLTFSAMVTVTEPLAIVNTALVDDGEESYELSATTIANGLETYLPVVMKGW
jgi:uncharacterized repeat protein (TIGR01451 family)